MATLNTKFKLNTGADIPAVGFGTWQDKDAQEGAVTEALKAGYTHIDTARIYGTEPAVGAAIKKSGIPRSQIFITTKLWNNAHHPDDVEPALDASLSDLGTDYVDLYLMHWPVAFARGESAFPKDSNGKIINGETDYVDTWKAMEKAFKKGKAKAIGISNFSRKDTERLLKETEVVPAANQLEVHPYLQQLEACEWFKSKGIHVQHYSPFGNQNETYSKGQGMSKVIDDPTLVEIGKKYGKNGAQVALAWGIAQGHSVLPKSKTTSRIKDNLDGDFRLEKADLDQIRSVDKQLRFNDPSANFGFNFYIGEDGKVE
ncbi:MAG: hypothetical protein LQ348_005788 [Seirophora lacunosa]|nr:MAG: hypothetical protein LQ348_005788 [Seirophora lacunosa]